MSEDEAANALLELMHLHFDGRFHNLKRFKRKVAHYTTAENAMNIISGKQIWLRNAALMNDFSEIRYGKTHLARALNAKFNEIDELLNVSHSGLATEVRNWLNEAEFTVDSHTYLTSFAEHYSKDSLGKLSMWRAYGGPVAGVAIVFNTDVFESEVVGTEFQTYMYPIFYGSVKFKEHFDNLVLTLQNNQHLLAQVSRARIKSILFHALQNLVLTAKHPGFSEEKEWRIIHSPFLFSSAYVQPSFPTIRGIPQVIYKIELRDQPNLNAPELELDKLIHSVIIGPCQYPEQVASALDSALQAAGVTNSRDRIRVSRIPLRQGT
jgi:Protein of unknown function (DUF2971)